MTHAAIAATIGHAAAVAEATRLQQAYSDLTGRYEALLRDCHPAYSADGRHLAPVPAAIRDVIAERRRQVQGEHWTAQHDDTHADGELAQAAAAYALVGSLSDDWRQRLFPSSWGTVIWALWPSAWSRQWFKPEDRRRDLARAAALLIAEMERLDRTVPAAAPAADGGRV